MLSVARKARLALAAALVAAVMVEFTLCPVLHAASHAGTEVAFHHHHAGHDHGPGGHDHPASPCEGGDPEDCDHCDGHPNHGWRPLGLSGSLALPQPLPPATLPLAALPTLPTARTLSTHVPGRPPALRSPPLLN